MTVRGARIDCWDDELAGKKQKNRKTKKQKDKKTKNKYPTAEGAEGRREQQS